MKTGNKATNLFGILRPVCPSSFRGRVIKFHHSDVPVQGDVSHHARKLPVDTHAWSKLKGKRIQDRQKETKPFNHLNVSFEIRPDIVLREVTVEDAAAIYRAIDTHRNYMRTWLPFVDNLKSVADEENFLKGVLSAPADSYEPIFGIWNRENEICGLIGFQFFRLLPITAQKSVTGFCPNTSIRAS